MPRIKAREQDENYEKPEPKIYRRYSQNTKRKLQQMVIGRGMKTSSAAKLLKVKNSSAKMILRKLRSAITKKQKNSYQKQQEQQIEAQQCEKDEVCTPKTFDNIPQMPALCWIYYPFFYCEIVAEQNPSK